ncbi:MAG TPA: hypothetical protein DCW60_02095 [Sutterella sp.]|nr:hypothetical protein [Sutterella sp.]
MAKILILNGHCLGEYCRVQSIPQTGATVIARGRKAVEDGGKGTNAALAIGRMGGDVGFIGKCGEDEGGRLGAKWMGDAGVDLTHYRLSPEVNTIVSLVVVADDGQNIIINFVDDDDFIRAEEVDEAILKSPDAKYIIGGFELPWKTVLHGLKTAKGQGLVTVLNASPLDDDVDMQNLDYVDYLVVNETETEQLLGAPRPEGEPWTKAAAALKSKFGCANVIITLGASGSVALTEKETFSVPARAIRAVDTVGAGDGFVAILTWRLSEGDDLQSAMRFASDFSAYVCSFTGTVGVYPTPDALNRFLAKN